MEEAPQEPKERKIVIQKKYTVTVTDYDDGKSVMERDNDGFSVIELLGLSNLLNREIHEQFKGEFKADATKIIIHK